MHTLFIIDAYNLIYRMFYAVPPMHTHTGIPVNALFGVAKFLKGLHEENPQAKILVATDVGKSFRSEIYPEYKGLRESMPDNLRIQIEGIFTLFSAAQMTVLSQEGYEADDIIGSLCIQEKEGQAHRIVVISSDKDLCQFVKDGNIGIYDAMKRKFLGEKEVQEKFGVLPHQVRDYLAIVGDSSDNIPGITGFGPKKAQELLQKFGSLEAIYQDIGIMHYSEAESPLSYDDKKFQKSSLSAKTKDVLLAHIHQAFLSQKLATIITDLPIACINPEDLVCHLDTPEYFRWLQRYELHSLLPKEQRIISKKVTLHPKEIQTFQDMDALCTYIKKNTHPISFSGDMLEGFSLIAGENVFHIHPKNIDMTPLCALLLSNTVLLVGYNMKNLLKQVYRLQSPASKKGAQQASLF